MLVCTLPSPACMCSATNTRLRSTRLWMSLTCFEDRRERAAPAKISASGACSSRLPRRDAARGPAARGNVVVEAVEQPVLPAARARSRTSARASLRPWSSTQLGCGGLRVASSAPAAAAGSRRAKNAASSSASSSLLRERQLDVDALDAVGVVAEARQRDDDVLVDLERVGVLGDRRGARAVEPELLARLGATRRRSLRRRARWRCARPRDAARATASSSSPTMSPTSTIFGRPWRLRLGRVADRLHVALVEVLEAGEHRAAARLRVEIVLDLDDRRHRRRAPGRRTRGRRCASRGGMRCRMKRALVMRPSQPSFWTPGRPARNLSVTSLPRPVLAERRAGNRRASRVRIERLAVARRSHVQLERRAASASWILPRLWSRRVDLEPLRVAASPCATTRGCRAPCPTAPPSCRRRSSRRCRRCTTRRPTSGRTRTRGPRARRRPSTRCVTTPAPQSIVGDRRVEARAATTRLDRASSRSSFSVLMTAERRVSGIAPPV